MAHVAKALALILAAILLQAPFATAQNTPLGIPLVSAREDNANYHRIRLNPSEYEVQLVEVRPYLTQSLNITKQTIVSEQGLASTAVYSLREVWDAVYQDPRVVAVVPVGYLESAPDPQIAGYLELGGRRANPLMNAPNLDAIYCVDNQQFRQSGTGTQTPSTDQKPYLFVVTYSPKRPYQYMQNLQTVLNEWPSDSRFDDFFNSGCLDMVQVGPRILNPRQVDNQVARGGIHNRYAPEAINENPEDARARVVISYDLRGETSITLFPQRTPLLAIAKIISAPAFYGGRCQDTVDNRSQSCEYWAAALTSFEHAGLIARVQGGKVVGYGNTNTTIPAALIIRRRAAP